MSVIRMIKLFGWEPRVADQLAQKREDELKYIRKNKILELTNNNIKYALSMAVLSDANSRVFVALLSRSLQWLRPMSAT